MRMISFPPNEPLLYSLDGRTNSLKSPYLPLIRHNGSQSVDKATLVQSLGVSCLIAVQVTILGQFWLPVLMIQVNGRKISWLNFSVSSVSHGDEKNLHEFKYIPHLKECLKNHLINGCGSYEDEPTIHFMLHYSNAVQIKYSSIALRFMEVEYYANIASEQFMEQKLRCMVFKFNPFRNY